MKIKNRGGLLRFSFIDIVKQPPEVFSKKGVLKNFANFTRKQLCRSFFSTKFQALESLFNNVSGLQACNFIKKRLRHRCVPVNIAKFLKTRILKNICDRLLLM